MNSLLSSEPVAACQVSKGNPADTLRATAAKSILRKALSPAPMLHQSGAVRLLRGPAYWALSGGNPHRLYLDNGAVELK